MIDLFKVSFHIEVWNDYDEVYNMFKYTSHEMTFWRSMVPPNIAVFTLNGLSEQGVRNWSERLDKLGAKYKVTLVKI